MHVITHFGWYEGEFMYLDVKSEEGLAAGLIDGSLAAKIGNFFGIIFAPLGFGDWRSTVATLTGLVAKENIVATFGILFQTAVETEECVGFWPTLASTYTIVSGYSLLVFNLLCVPCFAAVGAIKREMADSRWTWAAIAWECGFAYVIAFIVYHFGNAAVFGIINFWTVLAAFALVTFLYFLFRKPQRSALG